MPYLCIINHTQKEKVMKISIIEGHLTAVEKKVIKQMIQNDMDCASYKSKNYFISEFENGFLVKTEEWGWDCEFMRNKKVKRVYNAQISVA